MNKPHMNLARQQRGSVYGVGVMLAMFGVILAMTLKLAPVYMDHAIVVDTMEDIFAKNDIKLMSMTDIRAGMVKTLAVNSVEGFEVDNIQRVKEGSLEFVDVNYETRVPLFFNIEAVVVFKNRFNKF
jgi:Domain of unknown function (DUF4845)